MYLCKDKIFLHKFIGTKLSLQANLPIILKINHSKDDYYYVECEELGLFFISEYYEDICLDLIENLEHIWSEYVDNNGDEKLISVEASRIRNKLELYFKKDLIYKTDID